MNEMDELARMRDWVPVSVTTAETALLTAIRAERGPAAPAVSPARRGRRAAWQPALAGAAVVALTAGVVGGVVAAQPTRAGHPAGGVTGVTVRELAYRAAAAAAVQPPVRPGQWVYWQEKYTSDTISQTYNTVWTTAAATRAAYRQHGRVRLLTPISVPFTGQPLVLGAMVWWWGGRMPITYAGLGALPAQPQALVRYLANLHLRGLGPVSNKEFTVIEDLLTTYVMPPRLTAELYQALAYIHGVTINPHAVDVAGRHGVGFQAPRLRHAGGSAELIIINPHTYRLMGQDYLDHHRNVDGTAILAQALVSGPGVRAAP